jgi:putative ABC transport system permease protein
MNIAQDLRYALRSLRRNPGFTAVAVASIALGIGANTAIFSVVNGVLLQPMAYRDPDRLFVVRERIAAFVKQFPTAAANVRHYIEWRENCEAFEQAGAAYFQTVNLTGSGEPERAGAMRVSANFFDVLGITPRAGRTFELVEEQPGRDRVVVLTDGLWRRRFGADPDLLGRTIELDGAAHTVIGILPDSFRLPRSEHLGGATRYGAGTELFKPLGLDIAKESPMGEHDYLVVARLKPGVTPEHATVQLNAIQKSITDRYAKEVDLTAVLIPFREHVTSTIQRSLWVLMAAVFAVLLIVCANLANLMLVRAISRSRETAIRTAVGAGSWHILRLMLVEAGLIAAAGGALGVLIAVWAVELFVASAPTSLPRVDEVRLDSAVLGFATGITALAALVFGALPAFHALRSDPQEALRGGTHTSSEGRRGRRTRELLIGCEVAISAVLLIAAGLVMSSFSRLLSVDKGFHTENALTVEVELPKGLPSEQREQSTNAIIERVRALPGVRAAAATTVLPLEGTAHVSFVRREGDSRSMFELPLANYRYVSPSYLDALQMPLKKGRWFTPEDRTREVLVVSESAARTIWPGEDVIGKRVQTNPSSPMAEVIGVVADTRAIKLDRDPVLMVFVPVWKRNPSSFSLIVRTDTDPAQLAAAARREIAAVQPQAVVARVRTLERVMSDSLSARRFQLLLIGAFAAAALTLASLGIYGVSAYAVARRKAEIGIRMALGAAARDVHALVFRQGMRPVVAGLVVGIAGALALGRLLNTLLFGVSSTDPLTYATVIGVLTAAALVACSLPARRAVRTDPYSALRNE